MVTDLNSREISVEFLKEHLTFTGDDSDSSLSKLMFNMLASFAEFERSLIRERQRGGIALAKKKGVYRGRKPALTDDQAAMLRKRAASGEKKAALARELGISRETLYQYLRHKSARLISPARPVAGGTPRARTSVRARPARC